MLLKIFLYYTNEFIKSQPGLPKKKEKNAKEVCQK